MNVMFVLKALKKMNVKRNWETVKTISTQAGKPAVLILADMLQCAARYGIGPQDYALFAFCGKPAAQRKTYISRGVNNDLVCRYNDKRLTPIFDDKAAFNEKFDRFLKRSWLDSSACTRAEFDEFCRGREFLMYKPVDGACGKEIEKLRICDGQVDTLYAYLKQKPRGVIEEVVVQHPQMARMNPTSVNTVRVVSLRTAGGAKPLCAFLRMGCGSRAVDNLNSGGIAAKVDIDTGTITLPAADKQGWGYEKHPDTGEPIIGFSIPMWSQVIAMVEEAAEVIPQVGYVGWDVALTEAGPVIIEGNCYPGHDILQLPIYTPDGIGLKPLLESYISDQT